MKKLVGMSGTRIYRCWNRMLHRCNNSKNKDYRHYGGRGITVCDEWNDKELGFTKFYYWAMSHGYADELTIDRIDVNGNYEPSNCRWATIVEQRNNMRSNVVITHNGKTQNLKQWATELGISYRMICTRYEVGKSVDEILSTKVRCSRRYVEYNGVKKSVHDWAEFFGINQDVLSARFKRVNYDLEEVIKKFPEMLDTYNKKIPR